MSSVKPSPQDHQKRASRAFPQSTVSSHQLYQRIDMLNKVINILFICPCGDHAPTHISFIHRPPLPPWKCLISLLCTTLAPPPLVATAMSKLQFPPLCHACASKFLAARDIFLILSIQCIIFLPTKHNCKICPNMDGLIMILFLYPITEYILHTYYLP